MSLRMRLHALDLYNAEGKQLEKRQKTAGGKKKARRTRGGAKEESKENERGS